jgi:hypothetical protein
MRKDSRDRGADYVDKYPERDEVKQYVLGYTLKRAPSVSSFDL